ncbi:ATP-binding protein [Desulfurivibrio dismutans]|uniref:ATP-binding protein n=1 Tax=Desulfurivibrio dismutans TaxID=1398908 RepID=UPI0023D99D93|nr:ATP-binding protein [Desulfurivibrio alkaliphilus]MDF1614439.1 HAMP domain-containing protein [Desulfurivibrio alkaliphilus]
MANRQKNKILHRMLHRASYWLLGIPLRLKIMGMVLGIIFLFAVTSLYLIYGTLLRNMHDLLEKEGHSIAMELAHQAPDYLLINDLYGLTENLKNTVRNRPDLRYVVISDRAGQVVAHTFGGGFPRELLQFYRLHSEPTTEMSLRLIPTTEGMVWETGTPIMQGDEGRVRVGVRENAFRQQINQFLHNFVWNSLWVVLVGLLLSVYLTWLITRPINSLLTATRAVNEGDYRITLEKSTSDEVGALTRAFNDMVKQLALAEENRREKEKIRRDFLQKVIAGQEGERKRIARELHDQTGQTLASIMVELKMLENSAKEEEIKRRIVSLKQAITTEMSALHNLAVTLRPSVLDDMGLAPALEVFVNDTRRRHQLPVQLTMVGFGQQRPDSATETCVYRIVQEAVLNAIRHARANEIKVLLERQQNQIRGVVEDDGQGFNPEIITSTDRLGLYGMMERAQLLNGTLHIDSEPGQGTMVVFALPLMPGQTAIQPTEQTND